MDTDKINKLAYSSYKNNHLDEKVAMKISSLLKRSNLKKYINALKLIEKKKNVLVSYTGSSKDLEKIRRLFPQRKLFFKKEPSLLLGIKVVDNDNVYEFTLKSALDKIVEHIEQNYD